MKKTKLFIQKVIIAICSLSILFSCQNYLDVSPVSKFDQEFVFSSLISANRAVMGVYDQLGKDPGFGSRLSMMYPYDADDMLGVTGNGEDNGTQAISRYKVHATNTQLLQPFNQLYKGIERANICISSIPKMSLYENGSAETKSELRRLYGEVLTLRAQYYFTLIRTWGDVPAPFIPSYEMPTLYIEKSDRNVIYEQILMDLKQAEDLVPWKGEAGAGIDERITKGAIKGLRARIALARGGYSLRKDKSMKRDVDYRDYYQIARDECWDIMQRRDIHTLNPSFEAVFKDITSYKVESNGEVMFEVAMGKDLESKLGYYDGPRFYVAGNTQLLGNGSVRVLPVYFYAFHPLDLRRDVTIAIYQANLGTGIKIGINASTMTNGKFRADWVTPAPTTSVQTLGINWPILRFSDVLLMFAEADNELKGAPSPEAITAFEEVRKRAFVNPVDMGTTPTTYEDFFEAIVNERYFEFGGEGIRKYDLIRWNRLGEYLTKARDEMIKMRARQAPYTTLPQRMFYKENSTSIIWGNSFYTASPAVGSLPGYKDVAWVSSSGITTALTTQMAVGFVQNHSELFPLPHSATESNYMLKQDFGDF